MAGGLTWEGTPASGQDAHAALGMQNLSSGISPRSLTTSVEEQEKKTCIPYTMDIEIYLWRLYYIRLVAYGFSNLWGLSGVIQYRLLVFKLSNIDIGLTNPVLFILEHNSICCP